MVHFTGVLFGKNMLQFLTERDIIVVINLVLKLPLCCVVKFLYTQIPVFRSIFDVKSIVILVTKINYQWQEIKKHRE